VHRGGHHYKAGVVARRHWSILIFNKYRDFPRLANAVAHGREGEGHPILLKRVPECLRVDSGAMADAKILASPAAQDPRLCALDWSEL
jgi:hypothetical protein